MQNTPYESAANKSVDAILNPRDAIACYLQHFEKATFIFEIATFYCQTLER